MLFHLFNYLTTFWPILNVFHYVSTRTIVSVLSTVVMAFFTGNWFINRSKLFFRSKVREWTPEHHKIKNNTPTMGGIFILALVIVNTVLWCDLTSPLIWIFLLCLCGFGFIGGWDDWSKIKYKKGI